MNQIKPMNKNVMRKTILAIGLSLVTLTAMAQKSEIRKANRAMSSGNFTEALSELESAESQLDGAKVVDVAEFYFIKAKDLYTLAPGCFVTIKLVVVM